MPDSTPAQLLFDTVYDQRRFWLRARSESRDAPFRDLHIQLAWNNRRSARHWASELTMSREQVQAREVDSAIKRLAADIIFWRDALHCTAAELVNRIRGWERGGDMAYSQTTRGIAVAVMLDIHA